MIAEMVITTAYGYIERHSTIELMQVFRHVTAVLKDEVNYVQITITRLSITAIGQSQQSHGRSEMLSLSVGCPIETLGEQSMVFPTCLNDARIS